MRVVLALAAIPVMVLGVSYAITPKQQPPVVATPVQPEIIRAQRIDEATFRRRWAPVVDMPPATMVEYVTDERTDAAPVPRSSKPAGLRRDTCARHGMRKVTYLRRGYSHWRCRR